MPRRSDFDVLDLRCWLGDLHLVEIFEDDARYIVYGSNVARQHGREWTGRRFSELGQAVTSRLLGYYLDLRDARRPLAHIVPATIQTRYSAWMRLFLPFAGESGDVRFALVRCILLNCEANVGRLAADVSMRRVR